MARRKKKGDNRTFVAIVVDKSGSMMARRDETIDGYNEYLTTLGTEPGDVVITQTQFDTDVRDMYTATPLSDASKLDASSYVPHGMTALHDAIGYTIRSTERTAHKDDRVFLVVMTDGKENSSREYNLQSINALLDSKRKDNWEVVYLGAGPDSWAGGHALGFDSVHSINYGADRQAHRVAVREAAIMTNSVRSGQYATADSYLAASPVKAKLEADAGFVVQGHIIKQLADNIKRQASKR